MTHQSVRFGPRLVAHPTGALRAIAVSPPSAAIEMAKPLAGEPNAIHSRAVTELEVLVNTLRYFGCDVQRLVTRSQDPYASALADLAVVFESGAVMMRPFSMGRRSDVGWLEEEFERIDVPIAGRVVAPGLLGGGDVLLVGETAFIGASARNNALGRSAFAAIASAHGFQPVEVQLGAQAACLRAVAGAVSSDTVVLAPHWLDHAPFNDFKRVVVELGEELGAGVLNLGDNHVLADLRYTRANLTLRKARVGIEAIDLYDFGRVGITPSMLALDLKRA